MIINGKNHELKNKISITEMLEQLNLNKDKVVVEVNFEIVPKEQYCEWLLNKEDKVEIVSFVGGG